MRKLFIILCGIMLFCFAGCTSTKEVENKFELTEIDGISIAIKEGTLTKKGVTIIIKDTNGKGTYIYGSSFKIEKKENDRWVNPPKTDKTCVSDLMAYYVDEEGFLEFDQNWECEHNELEKGTYRLVKSTFLDSDVPITNDEVKYFSIEFTIDS